jgi:hypothetical protein
MVNGFKKNPEVEMQPNGNQSAGLLAEALKVLPKRHCVTAVPYHTLLF